MKLVFALLIFQAALARAGGIEGLKLPFGADAFDVQAAGDGALHALFSRKGEVYYAKKPAGKASFGEALPVAGPPIQLGGMERKPMLALGSQGRLHALWQTRSGLYYAASPDGGKTWKPQSVRDAGAESTIDMPTLAAGPDGIVHVVWVDDRDGHREGDDYGADLYEARTDARGRFGPNRRLTQGQPAACPCCQPAAAVDSKGRLWVAYRSSVRNIKESQVLIVGPSGIEGRKLSDHRWHFVGCPMAGPSLAVNGERAAVVWTSDGSMFSASSSDGGATFTPAERLGSGAFHAAATDGRDVLIVWDEGERTGWRLLGREDGDRLPIAPKGRLVSYEGGFRLVTASKARTPPH
jgi:hypothetical protein